MENKEQKMVFNASASSINLYLESELLFYARYINPQESDTYVTPVYGDAGNVVHECLEYYVNNINNGEDVSIFDLFDELWESKGIDNHKGLFNSDFTKKKPDYKVALQRGITFINELRDEGFTLYAEKEYFYPIKNNKKEFIQFHGFIDLIAIRGKEVIIFDYKTSSNKDKGGKFERQGKLYAWFVKKEMGLRKPPKVNFLYLKIEVPDLKDLNDKTKTVQYTNTEVNEYVKLVKGYVNDIIAKGFCVDNYSLGDYESNIFNDKVKFCEKQYMARNII